MKPEHAEHDTLGHEQRLAEALGALVEQCEAGGYRDPSGRSFKETPAFRHAQQVIAEFGVTHADGRHALQGDDPAPGIDGVLPEEPGAWIAEP